MLGYLDNFSIQATRQKTNEEDLVEGTSVRAFKALDRRLGIGPFPRCGHSPSCGQFPSRDDGAWRCSRTSRARRKERLMKMNRRSAGQWSVTVEADPGERISTDICARQRRPSWRTADQSDGHASRRLWHQSASPWANAAGARPQRTALSTRLRAHLLGSLGRAP